MTTTKRAVPTARSVDHVAYTVPDLAAAVAFFTEYLGGELIFYDGPFSDPADDHMQVALNVDPRASCHLAMLRMGALNLELFQYDAPEQATAPPRNSDIGGSHFAVYVDDVDAAHEYLLTVPGVVVQGGPHGVAPTSPVAGQRWFYFLTPWGQQMEITSAANDSFYRGLPGERMAPPSPTWQG